MHTRKRNLTPLIAMAVGVIALSGCGGGGGGFGSDTATGGAPASASGPANLNVLIGASNDVELGAVKTATAAWAAKTGNTVTVTPAAKLTEELAKGFAGGTPPDLFYVDPAFVGNYAKAGNLFAYGDQVADVDYLDSLKQTFTYDGKLQCAPKDFSTLALIINEEAWAKAGLSDADVPKTWADLETVATKLTTGDQTGLVFSGEHARIGVFLRQAGGWFVSPDGTTATVNSPENVAALEQVKKMLASGSVKYAKQVDTGWGGEALIKGKAAMVIEGNWIRGALAKDAPNLKAKVVELPTGPKGKGTLMFTNCWGIAAKSKNQAAAIDLVKFLGATDQQLASAKAFGVMPSTTSANEQYATASPADAAFIAGGEYGQGPVNVPGFEPVLADLNSKLEGLAKADVKTLLDAVQKEAEAALKG